MRKSVVFSALVGLIFMSAHGAAGRQIEGFESYAGDGWTTEWLFSTDRSLALAIPNYYSTSVADPGNGGVSGYFILNSTNYSSGNSVYFESNNIPLSLYFGPDSFSADLAFAPMNSNTLGLTGVEYYFYTNNYDTYYTASATPLPVNPSVLQTYPSVGLAGSTDTWQQYDWNEGLGDWVTVGAPITLTDAITSQTLGVGIEMDFDPATLSGGNYMTIWVDNVPIPEPSALMLGCFGALGFLARRRRRTA